MRIKNKKGQSTVEYVLLVTAVVAVMIAFATGQRSGGFQNQLSGSLSTAAQGMSDMEGTLSNSHVLSNSSTTPPPTPYSVDVAKGLGS